MTVGGTIFEMTMGLWGYLGPLPAHHGSPGQMTRGLSRWPLILTVCSQPFSFVPIDLRRLVDEARLGDDVDEVVRSFIISHLFIAKRILQCDN